VLASYATILTAIAPVFLVMGAGAVFQRGGLLSEELETGVMKLVIRLLAPCLIFSKVAGNPDLEQVSVAAWSIGSGLVLVLIGFGVAYLAARLFRFRKGDGLRTFAISAGIQNYGFMPLPLVLALWPADAGPAGLIFVHGLGVEIALWTVGLYILTHRTGPGWRMLLNPPLIAVVVSLLLTYTGGHVLVPGIVKTAIGWLGDTAIPMSLFMIGATIGRLFSHESWTDAKKVAITGCLVRLGVLPVLFLTAARFLPMPEDLQKVLVVQAGMPAAVFPIVVARLYGGHPHTAIQVILATTIASVATAPLVIAFGLEWLGFSY